MSVYVRTLKSGNPAFLTEGPKAVFVDGGKKSAPAIESLNILLGQINILCEGVHVGAMYTVDPSGFNWSSADGLQTAINNSASVSGDIFSSGTGPGTLISRQAISDPAFSTAFKV